MAIDTHGNRRRREILQSAADMSTSEGLDRLSYSQLASEVGLTKAGVAAHFPSKEQLQLAVVAAAAEAYRLPLDDAAANSEPGLPRLAALARAWLKHLDTIPYRSGCFFGAAGQAFAGRPGPVRNAIAQQVQAFLTGLEEQARLAARLGELASDADPQLLAFQIHGLAQEANMRRELLQDPTAFACARKALTDLLDRSSAAALDPTPTRRGRPAPNPRTPRRPKESS